MGDELLKAAQVQSDNDVQTNKVRELAGMSTIEYAKVRKQEAKILEMPVNLLDRAVKEEQSNFSGQAENDCDRSKFFKNEPTPWPESVNGAEVLSDIKAFIKSYVILPKGAEDILPLWILHTYTIKAHWTTPYLLIWSPEPESGKSSLLTLLFYLCAKSYPVSSISASSVYRSIEKDKVTLLIDESDTFLDERGELVGILNSGHSRGTAFVSRTEKVGDKLDDKNYCTFGPKAIAAIGKPKKPALISRSINIAMKRKLSTETTRDFDSEEIETSEHVLELRQKAQRWAIDNLEGVRTRKKPEMPSEVFNRGKDNWKPLLAIADQIGGEWPGIARQAMVHLLPERDDRETKGTMLLRAIKKIFEDEDTPIKEVEALHSQFIVNKLNAVEDGQWSGYRNGQGISKHQLSRYLKPYKIYSHQVRAGAENKNLNGYDRVDFKESWAAYVDSNSTTLQPSNDGGCGDFQNSTQKKPVEFQNPLKPAPDKACRVVEDGKGVSSAEEWKDKL